MSISRFGLAVVFALSPVMAQAQEIVRSFCPQPQNVQLEDRDVARLTGLLTSRTMGLGEAMASPEADQRAALSSVFGRELSHPDSVELGNYKCRTMKLGGLGPLVVYGWFDCVVNAEDAAITLRKTTGSQQMFGLLYETKRGFLYRGALKYGYEDHLTFYGTDPERDQVGCLSQIGEQPGYYVLELPSPVFESTHDVLEMVRVD